jgi:hypothetical protein
MIYITRVDLGPGVYDRIEGEKAFCHGAGWPCHYRLRPVEMIRLDGFAIWAAIPDLTIGAPAARPPLPCAACSCG